MATTWENEKKSATGSQEDAGVFDLGLFDVAEFDLGYSDDLWTKQTKNTTTFSNQTKN